MSSCQFIDCKNAATEVVYRHATEEERKQGTTSTDWGKSVPAIFEIRVCDEHLEKAQDQYPYIANKEP